MELAVVQHPSILRAREELEASGFDVEGAKWGRFPTITSETRAPVNNTQSLTKIEQPIWTAGRIGAQIELSEANQLIARSQLREAVSPAADFVLANARLQQAIGERIQLLRLRDAARISLQQWSLSQVTIAKPLKRIDAVRRSAGGRNNDADLVSKAIAYSAKRRGLQHQLEAAQAQRSLAVSRALPTVIAGYQQIWGGTVPSSLDRGTAYVALQFQPGAGLTALTIRQAAARREDAALQELVGLERELTAQVETLLADIDASDAQLAPARTLLKGSAEVVDSYLRQYQVGRRNWVEVLNAQREKAQAAYSLADVEQTRDQAQVRLLIITGEITPNSLRAIDG